MALARLAKLFLWWGFLLSYLFYITLPRGAYGPVKVTPQASRRPHRVSPRFHSIC